MSKWEPDPPGTGNTDLQDHCNRLNAMNGDRYWFVIQPKDGKRTIDNKVRER